MYEGKFIKTFPLATYPAKSQELMFQIVSDFEKDNIPVKRYEGSYSVISMFSGATTIKILCTINSNYILLGTGVADLFRVEFTKQIGLQKINEEYLSLNIKSNIVSAGGGTYRDFYFTSLDSEETYLKKKADILNLTKILNGRRFKRTVF